ncbi:MAG: mechanosensitive ion channel family protein [Mesorhizobium sp.]|uniref:mechanosensitive ion channel family protein n=1 Tax=unclassified Mesorhizobium TaxID=325217 RepID=UPI000FCA2C3F|nr:MULTISPECIES: mechanosensitive ion channel domain-containing protein [unclassified Mesorhizobium]RUU27314.1 mechanosensitive ion channel family protein [Mesorhizobium sp. M6A.T.Ce.TU.016.01.1.1]RUU96429.1 mechanosensitive ion channel family protein [Mesorhizobium sp. M6A.T.Cr.TU.017.01.1.1]RWO99165.1 MAG: mechanosensitive ion channel family protein [Mesorhizobium sp.]RWP70142.1 MAG: mechanosensitive ion channel family protein [Mesorhizobium sp.]RWQ68859.1 MAG: mechanosensitive ion channel f
MDFRNAIDESLAWASRWFDYAVTPWFFYQAAIIVVLFLVAKLAAQRIEPLVENRARQIKGHPGLLRVVVALLRRTDWILFTVFLLAALFLMRAVTWPSRSHFITIALSLSLAWLFASVLSRIIRNRFVARALAWLTWIYAALVILGIDDDTAAFLDSLAIPLGAVRLSALMVLKAALLLIATVWLAVVVGKYIDERVRISEELTPSIRVLVGKVAKVGLVLVAGVIALSSVGLDLTALTIFSGAVGVGLAFGLQKVVSNFVSGMIILLDKSIKPGDTISLEGTFGWVRELRARFVSVVTRDGREYLIPNEDFITQRVINWSFSDNLVRLDVNFGVSYDADPHKVSELAIAAATSVGRVEAGRRPVCWLTDFGDSSLNFVLRFWIHDPQQGLTNVRGRVLLALWDTFRENGIDIPYPHREIIMKPDGRVGTSRGR